MAADPPPPEDAAGAPEPPIVSLDEARQKRKAQREAEAEARQKAAANQLESQALTDAIVAGRMQYEDLLDMLRLGIVAHEGDVLPCEDHHRSTSYFDWMNAYYADEGTELDARQQRCKGAPSEVDCPLMAVYDDEEIAPPCIEALLERAEAPTYGQEKGDGVMGLDENDPIFVHQVRPCVVMGRAIISGIMPAVWAIKPPE